MCRSMEKLGKKIALFPPFGNVNLSGEDIQRWLGNRAHSNVAADPSMMIFDIQFFPHFAGRPRIGFAVFETDGFTPLQRAGIRSLDYILVPSKWAQRILEEDGFKAYVVNEGYDPEEFPSKLTVAGGYKRPEGKIFTFLHVGKFEERKGTAQAIRCFAAEFDPNEPVSLALHVENQFLEGGGRTDVSREASDLGFKASAWAGPGIPNGWQRGKNLIWWSSPRRSLAQIYRDADCGLFPSKGEGWGLPIMECIASGTPAIVGRWTAMTEYIAADYPEQLQLWHAKLEKADDGVWFHGDRGDWHVPEDDEVRKRIRWAYENVRTLAESTRWIHAVAAVREFTWDRAARQLDETVQGFIQHERESK